MVKKNLKHLKSKKLNFRKKNIKNFRSILPSFKNVDVVVHLLLCMILFRQLNDPKNYINTKIIGTMNVLEAMRFHDVKKIYISASSSCYGIPKKLPN